MNQGQVKSHFEVNRSSGGSLGIELIPLLQSNFLPTSLKLFVGVYIMKPLINKTIMAEVPVISVNIYGIPISMPFPVCRAETINIFNPVFKASDICVIFSREIYPLPINP